MSKTESNKADPRTHYTSSDGRVKEIASMPIEYVNNVIAKIERNALTPTLEVTLAALKADKERRNAQ